MNAEITPSPSPRLVIGICTYRRVSLAATLHALKDVDTTGFAVEIVVADNDSVPSAADTVQAAAKGHPLPVSYLHAPFNNISVARNALLSQARSTGALFLVFLDDDERPDRGWLAALAARQAETGAGVVLGPVRGDYGPDVPDWIRRAATHDIVPVEVRGGQILTGYTGNALLCLRDPALADLSFDVGRGRTGGEDTAFFRAFTRAGGVIAYAPEAVVHEEVPPDRASFRWLVRRRFRMGQTHASLLREDGSRGRLAAAGLAAAKALACLGLAALKVAPAQRNRQLLRAALHAGVVARFAGVDTLNLYSDPGTPLPDCSHNRKVVE